MSRPRTDTIRVLGLTSILLGLTLLVWPFLGRSDEVPALVRAAFGSTEATSRLRQGELAAPGTVFVAALTFALEFTLAGMLLTAGIGLLMQWRWARRGALFCCCCLVAVESLSTLLRVFCLTPAGGAVKLVPVIVNGLATLCGIALWGGLCLPQTLAAYGHGPEPPPPTAS